VDISFLSLTLVFVAALFTALATGLGAVPFAFLDFRRVRWLGLANAIAAGVMLRASLSLLVEAGGESLARTAIGGFVGIAFIYGVQFALERTDHHDVAQLAARQGRKGLLIIAVMTAHSTAEGMARSGCGRLEKMLQPAAAQSVAPPGTSTRLIASPSGML
jgi:ZIP family zinc transporter